MKISLDVKPESVQEQSGSLGSIEYQRGNTTHKVAFRASKTPRYSVNGKKKPVAEMPDTIFSAVGQVAVNMGWISKKELKGLH